MRCDILTLFPDMVAPVLGQSILKRAQEKGLLHVHVSNLRDYTLDRHKVADDVPYGGGAGMVMKAEPILRAVEQIQEDYARAGKQIRLLLPSPQGRPLPKPMRRISRATRVDSSLSAATMRGSTTSAARHRIPKKCPSGTMC